MKHRPIADIEADLRAARHSLKGDYLNPTKVARCERLWAEFRAATDAAATP